MNTLNTERIPFLMPNNFIIRKSIRGIDDSYNNFWDIIAELVQNSVDAINKTTEKKGSIKIIINSPKKSIQVIDTGIGIEKDKIPILLTPFSTDKEDDKETIGEKGVGLKFVLFESDNFIMKTTTNKSTEKFVVKIPGAKTWKNSTSEEDFCLNLSSENKEEFRGTDIYVEGIENQQLFGLDFESIKYVIRTKTAIGNVLNLFNDNSSIDVTLVYTDLASNTKEEKIDFKYWIPTESLEKKDLFDLDVFKKWLVENPTSSDSEKRNKLKNRIIYKKGEFKHNSVRTIKYWSCFVPQRTLWKKISCKDGLLNESEMDNEEVLQDKFFTTHQSGIYTSVKGMPTGIVIDPPLTGKTGYWPNLFMIFEDDMLKFDIGRKSINGSIKNIYKKYAKEIFSDYTKYISKYIAGEPDIDNNPIWNRDEIKRNIDSLPSLNNSIINFKKLPSEQEACVAAILYELIGMEKIDKVKPIISGYREKYDLYAEYNNHFICIEFKSHLRNIIRDFENNEKYANEIDYIVCWDVNDTDIQELNKSGIYLTTLNKSTLFSENETIIPETTHILNYSNQATPIYIIDLKKVLYDLENN